MNVNCLKVILATLVFSSCITYAQEKPFELKYGVDKKGLVTSHWIDSSEINNQKTANKHIVLNGREMAWIDLISEQTDTWKGQLDQIATPFINIDVPTNISIVVGNRGRRDAFTHTSKYPSTIFFNVAMLAKSYGDPSTPNNKQRINRIFSHEYTHLLQHRWSQKNPYQVTNHLQAALNTSYKEGFGHFRSISNKWKDKQGMITDHALARLKSLEKVFVERMVALNKANDKDAKALMKGLSTGPFHKKWGALTVALWLTKEAEGNDKALIKWVELGPEGILELANKHLPQSLKTVFNTGLNIEPAID